MLSKLHGGFFYLLILLLPTQLGLHFWPEFAHVLGLRVDYLSPTLYLTDIIVSLILVSWLLAIIFKKEKLVFGEQQRALLFIFYLLSFIILLSLFSAQNFGAGVYRMGRFIEMLFLTIYIVFNIKNESQIFKIIIFLMAGAFYSSVLAILQFASQHSLGLWFLGERTFNASTPGISLVSLDGTQFLRPYATFPHPNVLAGYLVVVLILSFYLLSARSGWPQFRDGSSLTAFGLPSTKLPAHPFARFIAYLLSTIYYLLLFCALFLTFSRTAWMAAVIGLLVMSYWLIRKRKGKNWKLEVRSIFGGLIFFGAFFSFSLFLLSPTVLSRFSSLQNTDAHSLILRQKLNSAAVQMIGDSPFFGVGMGNFLVRLPEYFETRETIRILQPVHNIFLLVGVETGLLGLFSFLALLLTTCYFLLKKMKGGDEFSFFLLITVGAIIFLSFFDHYFWTLKQGQLLFWVMVGLAYAKL